MTNDTVMRLVIEMQALLLKSSAPFYSVSQNDDAVYCECKQCKSINNKSGGPQGSHYFLNKIQNLKKITTLAYLHTYKPPINLKIEPNIYTLFCPIELNRGKSIVIILARLLENSKDWGKLPQIYICMGLYCQFSNYLSPFPNILF
jgi:hypothetical protein